MKLQNIDTFHHFGLVGMKAMLRSRDSKSSYLLGFLLYLQGCIQRHFLEANFHCFLEKTIVNVFLILLTLPWRGHFHSTLL